MLSSERLFSILLYALFISPAVIVMAWVAWRLVVWCLFHAGVVRSEAPRLFAPSRSRTLSRVFLTFLVFLAFVVPLRYLADGLEGPQIAFWHWLLVFGPVPVLIVWLAMKASAGNRPSSGSNPDQGSSR